MSSVNTVVSVPDPECAYCFLVRGPHDLVRLCPSLPPMNDYYTAHFLEGSPPAAFTGRSPTGMHIGVPCRTKDEMVALLWAE